LNFRVVRNCVARVRERAIGSDVLQSLSPAQQVVKIVHEELIALLGEPGRLATTSTPPLVLMLVGLQGSGKTTTAAKLALHLKKQGQRPLLVAADPYRPAAISQLQQLGKNLDVPVFTQAGAAPPDVCLAAVHQARSVGQSVVIFDTAGRLHVDDDLMNELVAIKSKTSPADILLVADA